MAQVAGLPVVTHTFGELGVATAAVLQLHAAYPNFILDNQTYYWNLEDDIIEGGLMKFEGPYLQVPQGPGLGVTLDSERMAKYAQLYTTSKGSSIQKGDNDSHYDRNYILRPRV